MTVKDDVGRTRYVAFRLAAPLSRSACEKLLPPGARLTRFDGTLGIARTTHRELAAMRDHLARQPVAITTLATSGTLRAVAARLPEGALPRAPRARGPSADRQATRKGPSATRQAPGKGRGTSGASAEDAPR